MTCAGYSVYSRMPYVVENFQMLARPQFQVNFIEKDKVIVPYNGSLCQNFTNLGNVWIFK